MLQRKKNQLTVKKMQPRRDAAVPGVTLDREWACTVETYYSKKNNWYARPQRSQRPEMHVGKRCMHMQQAMQCGAVLIVEPGYW